MRKGRLAIILIVVSTLFTSTGNGLLKYGVDHLSFAEPFSIQLLIGIGLYGIAASMFILALRWGELSVIYPLYGLNFVWISFIALKFFDEAMPPLKWFGMGLIMLGMVFIGRSGQWHEDPTDGTVDRISLSSSPSLSVLPPTTAVVLPDKKGGS